jgi:hypothetical protein
MRMFWGLILMVSVLLLFSCSGGGENSTSTTLPSLTWDAPGATWDNVKWN